MRSIISEISKLRHGLPIIIDYGNSNRYRLVISENNGSKTAYYFTTPIYNCTSRKIIDMQFSVNGDTALSTGSNAAITISDRIKMKNAEACCTIRLRQRPQRLSSNVLNCGEDTIYPTTNGVAIQTNTVDNNNVSYDVEVSAPFLSIRANDRCFALMTDKFKPFVVFSCIGTLDASGNVIAPAGLEYQKITERKYRLSVSSCSQFGQSVLFEVNLYESKLFQDTTVESGNPNVNNVFGSIGFIGNTPMYGEQWLYSRPDHSKMSELTDKRINKAVLHLPQISQNCVELKSFRVSDRFCSFGSTWDNKIPGDAGISESVLSDGYQSIDISSLMIDQRTQSIVQSEGLILKPKIKGSGFSAVATGDSYFAPQILEINYR